jgi:squalene-associated FAD-dependent desaturase
MSSEIRDAIVVGGGLAGLSAAVALAGAGAQVTLLERRPYIGGRAYSYDHPALGETLDSQHVVLGCCTNILQLCEQAGMADAIRWYDELVFLEPGGRRSPMRAGSLPAPAHQALSFLRAPMLGLRDKLGIATGLARFLRGYPKQDTESFAAWLRRTGQTERAIRHFWEPVVVGALNDGFERCSVKYAGKVFHESFLRSAEGGRLGIPTAPLSEFFAPVAQLAQRKGVVLKLKAGVEHIERIADGRWQVLAGGEEYSSDTVVLATDFKQTRALLSGLEQGATEKGLQEQGFEQFVPSPITTVHLWYDRDVTQVDHAVLLDTRIQWVFAKSRIRRWPVERGSYLELVISASWPELEMSREQILSSALREVEMFFPAVRQAKLMKSGVLKEARATFSVTPGLDRFRPQQATEWPGLYLAGDWTATEWPSTMEGAVRSGRLAAGAVVGNTRRFMVPETPASGLMRWVGSDHDDPR